MSMSMLTKVHWSSMWAYFLNPQKYFCSDGSGDGKVDSFFEVSDGDQVRHYVLNTKFTKKYDAPAPVSFYDEITRFWQAFANKPGIGLPFTSDPAGIGSIYQSLQPPSDATELQETCT